MPANLTGILEAGWGFRESTSVPLYANYTEIDNRSLPVSTRRRTDSLREMTFSEPILTWLSKCDIEHQCGGETTLPSRILDVRMTDKCGGMICLYESNGEIAPYACLSYCWGNASPLRTTKDTYAGRHRGISFESLPAAFQDAVTVTRTLGIRYLWKDALCIMQDSLEYWEVESSNMSAIIRNVYLVISADISENCGTQFLSRTRSNGLQGEQMIGRLALSDSSKHPVYGRDYGQHPQPLMTHYKYARPDARPLGKRAWALQEEVLATRIVHFTEDELYWQCDAHIYCECTDLDCSTSHHDSSPRLIFKRCLKPTALEAAPWKRCLNPTKLEATSREWHLLINDYASGQITHSMDRSAALSGILTTISDAGHLGKYIAGLWSAYLPSALLWSGDYSSACQHTPYRAPS